MAIFLVFFSIRQLFIPRRENSQKWGFLQDSIIGTCHHGKSCTEFLKLQMRLKSFQKRFSVQNRSQCLRITYFVDYLQIPEITHYWPLDVHSQKLGCVVVLGTTMLFFKNFIKISKSYLFTFFPYDS